MITTFKEKEECKRQMAECTIGQIENFMRITGLYFDPMGHNNMFEVQI